MMSREGTAALDGYKPAGVCFVVHAAIQRLEKMVHSVGKFWPGYCFADIVQYLAFEHNVEVGSEM